MVVEKINEIKPQINIYTPIKASDPSVKKETDGKLSTSAKYMLGATALAGVIAIGIIGHKNNWWRKAANTINNGETSHSTSPERTSQSNIPETSPNSQNIIDPVARTINKVNSVLSKEVKHAKRALKQYSEVFEEIFQVKQNYQSNYIEFLRANELPYEIGNKEVKIFDKDGNIARIIKNYSEEIGTMKGSYIEYFNKEGRITKRVSFPNPDQTPLLFFYDKNGHLSKRISPIMAIFSPNTPNLLVSEYRNNKLLKESIYLLPDKVYRTIQYKPKGKVEYGFIDYNNEANGKFIIKGNQLFKINGTELKATDMQTVIPFDNYRCYRFNNKNEIVKDDGVHSTYMYSTINTLTGDRTSRLAISDNNVDFIEDFGNGRSRRIFEDFDDQNSYMDIPYINDRAIRSEIRRYPKKELDIAHLKERYKYDEYPS